MRVHVVYDGRYCVVDIGAQDTLASVTARAGIAPGTPVRLLAAGEPLTCDADLQRACRLAAPIVIVRSVPGAHPSPSPEQQEKDKKEEETCTAVADGDVPRVQPMCACGTRLVCLACTRVCCANAKDAASGPLQRVELPLPFVCQCSRIAPGHCRLRGAQNPSETKTETKTKTDTKAETVEGVDRDLVEMLAFYARQVETYEDPAAQEQAVACVDLDAVEARAERLVRESSSSSSGDSDHPRLAASDAFWCALCRWYKEEFFTFVDVPRCAACGAPTVAAGVCAPSAAERAHGAAGRVELYRCAACGRGVRFPRYNDATRLLATRCGRCGEAANCFCLLCRALGADVRLVVDATDHVWAEVRSAAQARWVHCDPCEGTWDKPLTYERGWRKALTYVVAFSADEALDVTRRYTEHYAAVLVRRTRARESALTALLDRWTARKLAARPPEVRAAILARRAREMAELEALENGGSGSGKGNARGGDCSGRVSGSAEWRAARGETGGTAINAPSFAAWSSEHPSLMGGISISASNNGSSSSTSNTTNKSNNSNNSPVQLSFEAHGTACPAPTEEGGGYLLTPDRVGCRGAVWAALGRGLLGRGRALVAEFAFVLRGAGRAEGLALVLQGARADALGEGGSGLGYAGVARSVAVELDTHDSYATHDDPNGNHVAVLTRGAAPNTAHHRAARACNTAVPPLADGRAHRVAVAFEWDAGSDESSEEDASLVLSVWLDGAPALWRVAVPAAPLLGGPGLWLGFTAATGGLSQEHRVRDIRCYQVRP